MKIIAKITITATINRFVIIVITNNCFDNALTEILQFRRALMDLTKKKKKENRKD